MAIIEANWNPSRKDLRVFGIAALVATVILACLLHLRKGLPLQWAMGIVAFGAVVFVGSLVLPKPTKVIYVIMVSLALPIGFVISTVLMTAFYYLLLTPLGLFFRLVRRDELELKFDRSKTSYWVKRRPPESLKRYFNQF